MKKERTTVGLGSSLFEFATGILPCYSINQFQVSSCLLIADANPRATS